NVCCESTARDAMMLNYKVFFVSDANACRTDAEHNATLASLMVMFADVRSTEEMIALLQSRAAPTAAQQLDESGIRFCCGKWVGPRDPHPDRPPGRHQVGLRRLGTKVRRLSSGRRWIRTFRSAL